MVLRRVGTVGSVGVAYHIPAAAHPDWAPLSLLAGILSQQPNGRLYKALVESKKATQRHASAGNNHDPGLFTASAQAEPGQLDAVRDTLLQTLENLATVPFTEDEVDKAKVRNRRNQEKLQSNSSAMAQALSSASALGDWRLLFVQRDRIRGRHGRRRQPRRPDLFPEGPTAPSASTSRKPSRSGWRSRRRRRSIRWSRTTRAARWRRPARPSTRRRRTSTPAPRSWTLGGIKAGLLPKKNRGETVSLVLTLHYGNEESLKGQTTAAGMLPGLMMAGTKKHDRQALREELDAARHPHLSGCGRLGGRGGRRGGRRCGRHARSVDVLRRSQALHTAQAISLLGEILREPAFPAAEFDTMKRQSAPDVEDDADRAGTAGQQPARARLVAVPAGRCSLCADPGGKREAPGSRHASTR